MSRGDLGSAGDLWLDLPALAQPYACVSRACTPGRRAPDRRSCCADLDVGITRGERAAITGALPEIAAYLAPLDPRWAHGPPAPIGDTLPRPGRRCVFAVDRGGLRCALHELEDATGRARGALKPMPCRLFPLVVVDLGDRVLLSAIHARTARLVDSHPARRFPCLGDPGKRPLVHGVRDTIVALWGAGRYRRIREQVRAWRLQDRR